MARRQLILGLSIDLDEDLCRNDDVPTAPDGDSPYTDTLDELRTTLHHHAATILAPYQPTLGPVILEYVGVDYGDPDAYRQARGAAPGTLPAEEAIRRTRGD